MRNRCVSLSAWADEYKLKHQTINTSLYQEREDTTTLQELHLSQPCPNIITTILLTNIQHQLQYSKTVRHQSVGNQCMVHPPQLKDNTRTSPQRNH